MSGDSEDLILFFFIGVSLGAILTFLLSRYSFLPYTVAVFFTGLTISAIISQTSESNSNSFISSARKWQDIDPHLMLFLFLPILIYGDAISLNWTQVKSALIQTIILAGPGVLIGAFLMGLFVYYCTSLNWSWYLCMLFGSILSGTDPVAVVALLKDVNTSPRLFMLIIGESLLNDGTSIVMYTLYHDLLKGDSYNFRDIIFFFFKMLIGSPTFGIFCGFISLYFLQASSKSLSSTDRTIQIIITISCSYLVFYFSEKTLHLSGILGCGAAGLMIAKKGLPYLVDIETIHIIWELFEWFGNTLIFFLAGIIYGGKSIKYSVTGNDFVQLILLYIILMLLRSLILFILYPSISSIGLKCTYKEVIFMSWSGLRGSLSMALGLAVLGDYHHLGIEKETAEKFFFFIGGICTLTLLINATTASFILKFLDLIENINSSPELLSLQKKINDQLKYFLESEIEKYSILNNNNGNNNNNNNGNSTILNNNNSEFETLDILNTNPNSVLKIFTINVEEIKNHITLLNNNNSNNSHNNNHNSHNSSNHQSSESNDNIDRVELQLRESFTNNLTTSEQKLIYCRHMFLTCLKAQYWKYINEGKIPRSDKVTNCLLYSVDYSISNKTIKVCDWEIVRTELISPLLWDYFTDILFRFTPSWFPLHYLGLSQYTKNNYVRIYILINYIYAHEECQREIYEFIDTVSYSNKQNNHNYNHNYNRNSNVSNHSNSNHSNINRNVWNERMSEVFENEMNQIIEESKENVLNAIKFLQSLNHSLVSSLIWIIQTRSLLGRQAQKIEHLVHEGLLTPQTAEEYLYVIRNDIDRLQKVKNDLCRKQIELEIDTTKVMNDALKNITYSTGSIGEGSRNNSKSSSDLSKLLLKQPSNLV